MPHAASMAIDELCELVTSIPTLQQLRDFRVSEELRMRLLELRHTSNEGELTAEQAAEFDAFLRVEHVITMLKIKALKKLKDS